VRRGYARQREQRQTERAARLAAAQLARQLADGGGRWSRVAGWLHISERTLRRWRRGEVLARPLGRPVLRSSREVRGAVLAALDEHGPGVGVPTLRACFPGMSRAELADLLTRYRRVWRARNRVPLRVLTWSVVGSVWAVDFTGPRPAVDGRYPYLLAVRDLASGRQVLWQPVAAATAEVARDALAALFAEHGPPLVLKCDNGSPFTAAAAGELLAAHGVLPLHSPPHWPRYNGAVEAGIGALKDRTAARAARAGRAGAWAWDDAAGACAEANALSRPRGASGPSPDELWSVRRPITAAERAAFRASVEALRNVAQTGATPCAGGAADVMSERAMARDAIRLALERCGYLHYRRRTIPPPINARIADDIT
jgi:transposase InsO family protein